MKYLRKFNENITGKDNFEDFDKWIPEYFEYRDYLRKIISTSKYGSNDILYEIINYFNNFKSVDSCIEYCKSINSVNKDLHKNRHDVLKLLKLYSIDINKYIGSTVDMKVKNWMGGIINDVKNIKLFYNKWIGLSKIDIYLYDLMLDKIQEICDDNDHKFDLGKVFPGEDILYFRFYLYDPKFDVKYAHGDIFIPDYNSATHGKVVENKNIYNQIIDSKEWFKKNGICSDHNLIQSRTITKLLLSIKS